MIIVEKGREELFDKSFLKYEEDDTISYDGHEIPTSFVKMLFKRSKGISAKRVYELAIAGYEALPNMTPYSARMLMKKEHSGKADLFLENYPVCGNTKYKPLSEGSGIYSELAGLFSEDPRFHGHIPQILPDMAGILEYYEDHGVRRSPEEVVRNFQLSHVRELMNSGIPKGDVVNLLCFFPIDELTRIIGKRELCEMISSLITKGIQKHEISFLDMASWMIKHPDTNISIMRDIYEERKNLCLTDDMTVESVKTALSRRDSLYQVKEIENAYKKCRFKLSDCVCELRDVPITHGKYRARILDGTDPLQVILGDLTDCCQVLGDSGETSMMYGLTNAHAGFWVLENKNTGKVFAQALLWEYDADTLVFDNIEFANDAKIKNYSDAIAEYVENSPYRNIIMGCGSNGLESDLFERAPDVTPHVTPYDIYVMSYEEDAEVEDGQDEKEILCLESVEKAAELLESGKVTYYDYLYSDVDDNKGCVYLKENNVLSPFFGTEPLEHDDEEEELDDEY